MKPQKCCKFLAKLEKPKERESERGNEWEQEAGQLRN